MKLLRVVIYLSMFWMILGFTECYEPVTKSSLPKHIKTIAVPAFRFEPRGARYRIEARFTDVVVRELLRRGRGLKVQGAREGADAA